MKEGFTRIAVILDRSGSMNIVREATVAGFNEFVRKQQEEAGEATLQLVQFDDQYEVVFDKNMKDVPLLTQATFAPRGSTALYDAQGKTIKALGKELANMQEKDRPSKVIIVTITDGINNASNKYSLQDVADMIKHQQDVYNWEFLYIGANQNAPEVAQTMNIPMYAAMTYNSSIAGVRNMMVNTSNYTTRLRKGAGGQSAGFTEEERATSMVSTTTTNK